jgi:dCTP deaminase
VPLIDAHTPEEQKIFFEVFERALRFHNHVKLSKDQSASPNRRKTAQQLLADELLKGLISVINGMAENYRKPPESFNLSKYIHELNTLADMHINALVAVPRPCEPIELVSYLRQVINTFESPNDKFKPPLVFATEVLGDQAHKQFEVGDDLVELNKFVAAFDKEGLEGFKARAQNLLIGDSTINKNQTGYVSLPRIDLNNPLRWPSLIHEISHLLDGSQQEFISEHFKKFRDGNYYELAIDAIQKYLNIVGITDLDPEGELKSWLLECYCDAYAVSAAGVPALFSQMHAFLFGMPCYLTEEKPNKKGGYPPAWFRLRIMRNLITHRHSVNNSSNEKIKEIISNEWKFLFELFPPEDLSNISKCQELKLIYGIFNDFLTSTFPQSTWLEQSVVSPEILEDLIADLSNGLPIPTHKQLNGGFQIKASHAEVLTAGWAYRNDKLKKMLLDSVIEDIGLEDLSALIKRADGALQMSLQVSEWFSILQPLSLPLPETQITNVSEKKDTGPISEASGLIPDHEIKELIKAHNLRIIPLIGGLNSIEGTVVDLRLGHNFEIFFTNISGSIDPLSPLKANSVDSMEVDYDSLDGLEIAPGQFVLGHTLEYIKLPNNIAAEINARSSFARLGIEVHMTAPLVEAGFNGCLTLEIANSGHSSVKLYPGMRVAQLRFYRCTSAPQSSYADRPKVKYRGHLRHNKTAQFNDWEIDAFSIEREKRGLN